MPKLQVERKRKERQRRKGGKQSGFVFGKIKEVKRDVKVDKRLIEREVRGVRTRPRASFVRLN